AERRMVEQLELETEHWYAEQIRQEQQQRQAEAELAELRRRQQREQADRLAAQQAQRDAASAAQHAAQTRTALARQEFERRQRVAEEQRWAFFKSLGPMGNEPKQPSNADVLARLNEIADQVAEPEPTLHERLTDPRRFKFDWQP